MIGEKLGTYRIDAILGTGAMGVVYRATSESTGKLAAVKVISGETAQKGKAYERFRREAEILQQFRHPNIVRFLAVGRYQGTSYFAMEYVAGETLEQLLSRQGSLPWKEVVELGIQMCEALHYAHEHGVVHRDLKPSNLMVSEKGRVKLTDFGIAKDLDATALTATGRTLGTAAYMAPEQIRGTPAVSHKTDLYALGIVLYQMLTGHPAFEGSSAVVLMHAHLNQPVPRPSAKVAEIPMALDKLVVLLMAKDPGDRPWDAAAVAVNLCDIRDKASRGETVPMVWPSDGSPPGHPTRAATGSSKKTKRDRTKERRTLIGVDRSLVEVGLLVLGLVAIGGFVGYMFWPPSAEYLYQNAKHLMASDKPHDWLTARDEYLKPLEIRFPDYRKEARESWLDRIALNEAERRATVLESPVRTGFTEPKTRPEHEFVACYRVASEASEKFDDVAAIYNWDKMAERLEQIAKEPDGEDAAQPARPWILLARKRAAALREEVTRRRKIVEALLVRAQQSEDARRPLEAATIRSEARRDYSKYVELSDLLGPPPAAAAPGESPESPPASTANPSAKDAMAKKPESAALSGDARAESTLTRGRRAFAGPCGQPTAGPNDLFRNSVRTG